MRESRKLKKMSFVLTMVGIVVLLILLTFPAEILRNIDEGDLKEKVYFEGEVSNERSIGESKLINIDGIEVICDCRESYLGKEVRIEGLVDSYNGKRQIRALKIEVLD